MGVMGKTVDSPNELNKIEVVGGGSGAFIWNQNDGGNNGSSGGGAKYQLTSSGIGQADVSVISGVFESVGCFKAVGNYSGTGHAGGGGGAGGNASPSISADGEDGISIDWVNNAIGSTVYWAGGGGAGTNYHCTTLDG